MLNEDFSALRDGYFLESEMDTEQPSDAFARVMRYPESAHLSGEDSPYVAWMFFREERIRQGARVLGSTHLPAVQGTLSRLFKTLIARQLGFWPDYLVLLWWGFWKDASSKEREILVFHESRHMAQKTDKYGDPMFGEDGSPMWDLREHDVNEFVATVRRYGAYSDEIAAFIEAAGETHGT